MCSQDGQYDEGQARTNAAAFAGHFNADARQTKDEAIAKDGNTGPIEKNGSDFRCSFLQQVDGLVEQKVRNGDGEKKECQSEARPLQRYPAEEKREAGDPEKNQRQRA